MEKRRSFCGTDLFLVYALSSLTCLLPGTCRSLDEQAADIVHQPDLLSNNTEANHDVGRKPLHMVEFPGQRTTRWLLHECADYSAEPWEDSFLGTFQKDKGYCSSDCGRNTHCCRPQQPSELGIKFILVKQSEENVTYDYDDNDLGEYLEKSGHPIVFLSVGIQKDHKAVPQLIEIQKAYTNKGFNVVIVDWTGFDSITQVIQNVRVIGSMIGSLVSGFDLEKMTLCVGFGLGAHVCGEAGRFVKNDEKLLAKCHMLDPSGAYFDGCGHMVRQNKDDCHTVITVHTSQVGSSSLSPSYGTSYPSGHCDFWVNDGMAYKQANCNLKNGEENHSIIVTSCGHYRVLDYYLAQLRGECEFYGSEASKCGNNEECQLSVSGRSMRLPPFDLCRHTMSQDFYVHMPSNRPYPHC